METTYSSNSWTDTGRRFYEPHYVEETAESIEESTWRLMARTSADENLCDRVSSGKCEGYVYFTDSQWAETCYCQIHLDENFKDGTFIEVKDGLQQR